jgi:hypothetical protein
MRRIAIEAVLAVVCLLLGFIFGIAMPRVSRGLPWWEYMIVREISHDVGDGSVSVNLESPEQAVFCQSWNEAVEFLAPGEGRKGVIGVLNALGCRGWELMGAPEDRPLRLPFNLKGSAESRSYYFRRLHH